MWVLLLWVAAWHSALPPLWQPWLSGCFLTACEMVPQQDHLQVTVIMLICSLAPMQCRRRPRTPTHVLSRKYSKAMTSGQCKSMLVLMPRNKKTCSVADWQLPLSTTMHRKAPESAGASGCFLLFVFVGPHEVTILPRGFCKAAMLSGLFS